MNVRELNDEQLEQLGKVFETSAALCDRLPWAPKTGPDAEAYQAIRKLQEMLQPPKQYLVQWEDGSISPVTRSRAEMGSLDEDDQEDLRNVWEWQDDEGTIGERIKGDALRKLLGGES